MTLLATPAVSAAAEEALPVFNPYTGDEIGRVAPASPDEVGAVIARARTAADAFRFSVPAERRALLNRLAELLTAEAESLAQTVCAEVGKTITEARNEMRRAANTLRLSGDAATFLDGEVLHCGIVEGGVDRHAVTTCEPVGVVAAITPFNYPVNLLCHKLGPALAAGNAVIVKPSPKAPLAAARLVELCTEAGMPDGLVQVIQGGAETAIALTRGPIDLLSFTGGPHAGRALKAASGLVRCLMELGGNDPLFVMPDADLEAAARTAVAQRFEIAGQSCAAVKKLYVHAAVAEDFTEILMARVQRVALGNPADEATEMGPVIDAEAATGVQARIESAILDGAVLRAGGRIRDARFAPTLLTGVPAGTRLFAEETFGPVLAMRSFSDPDTALAEVNASPYGLQAGVFTNDHALIRKLTRELRVGGVMVNEGPDFRAEHVPFGGVKTSGLGREGVRIALREMSETKVVID